MADLTGYYKPNPTVGTSNALSPFWSEQEIAGFSIDDPRLGYSGPADYYAAQNDLWGQGSAVYTSPYGAQTTVPIQNYTPENISTWDNYARSNQEDYRKIKPYLLAAMGAVTGLGAAGVLGGGAAGGAAGGLGGAVSGAGGSTGLFSALGGAGGSMSLGLPGWLNIGSTVLSALTGKKASDAQSKASGAAIAEQRRQFDLTRGDLAPYMLTGYDALNRLGQASAGDMSGFFASPDYNFRRTEGTRGINNSFAARGGALSGNALRALSDFNSGLASQEYGNWWNRQAGRAGIGQTATNAAGQLGAATAGNIGNALLAQGDARASGINAIGNAGINALGNVAYNRGYYTPQNIPGIMY